jgi:MFS family permease
LSLRIAAYAGTSALSGVAGGLIAYAIGEAKNHLAISAWQTIFNIEGIPTIGFGVAIYFYLPDRPEAGKSSLFSDNEQRILLSRRTGFVEKDDNGIDMQQVKR